MMEYGNRYDLKIILTLLGICLLSNFSHAQQQSLGSLYGPSNQQLNEFRIKKGMSLRQALEKIEKHFDVVFLYRTDAVKNQKIFDTIYLANDVEKALGELLEGKQLQFKQLNRKTYGIYPEDKSVPNKKNVLAETVSGRVTDSSTGEALAGVNIKVKATTTGTFTNGEGHYELEVASLQDTLVFSFLGYQTQTVPINGRATINVALKSQRKALQQMVVVGYGEQKKENLTGSVSQVSSEGIELHSVNNTTQALRGLTPNLNVGITSQGGEADAGASLNIRGTGSLSGSNPYIIIDGVRASQSELSNLNPNDIENVSVLKGAAASAIYGSHAAFGAIVVKTKQGAENQGFSINYSNNIRFKRRTFVPPTVSSLKWAKLYNTASVNFSGQPAFSKERMSQIRAYLNGETKHQTAQNPNNPNRWVGIEDGSGTGWLTGYANTDWYDVMYKSIETTQKHDLSVQGGSDNITYYVSGGFLKDPGQLKYGDDNEFYKRYNLNSNIIADVTDWLQISNITRFSNEESSFPASLDRGTRGRFYHDIIRFAPISPYKTPAVKDDQDNVLVPAQTAQIAGFADKNGFNKYTIDNLVTTLKAKLDITNNLFVKGDFTFKRRLYQKKLNYKKWTLLGPDGKPSLTYQANNNQIRKDYRKTNYTSFNVYGDYDKTLWDNHNFHILIGFQQEANNYNRLMAARKNVIDNSLNSINVATGQIIGPNNPLSDYTTMGVFGRLQYNYNEKYLVEFDGRYDGSSRFAPNRRFVFSPSGSIGWRIDKEKFWGPVRKYINSFKIRASYGALGNQDVNNYLYLSTIPIHTKLSWVIGGERPIYTSAPSIISPNITWETVTTKNIGTDLALLDNRLTVSGDYYERDTDNMFGPSSALPAVLGTSPPRTNSASLRTRGWELSLGWQDQINSDFSYNAKFMASDNQTTMTKYNNPNKVIGNYYVGQKLGEIWGYETDGLFQTKKGVKNYLSKVNMDFLGTGWQPGDVKYKDLNGDGKVNVGENTANNPGDRRVIGNSHPRYRFSIQAGASWKNLSFGMLWQGVGKRDVWLGSSTLFWGWDRKAHSRITPVTYSRHWSKDNPDGYLPIPLDNNGSEGFAKDRHPTTRYLQNGAYMRLKSLKISYTLPSSLTDKVSIENLTVFVNGENLLTITNMWPNIDPELTNPSAFRQNQAGYAYPLAQTYGFGIDIQF